MSSLDRQIIQRVSKIKRRIHTNIILRYTLLFAIFGLGIGILLSILSLFAPIYDPYFKAACIVAATVVIGICFGFYKAPKIKEAALKADSLGLLERTVTAVELIGDESPIALLQKKDTMEHLEKIDYKRSISIIPSRKYLIISLLMSLVLIITGFIPSSMKDKAKELHDFKQEKVKQAEKVDKLIKKVNKVNMDSKLTKEQKEEIEAKISEIKKDINSSVDKKELGKAVQRSEKKIELASQKYEDSKKNFNKMIETLSKFEGTKNIANLMKSGDTKAVKEELKNLSKTLENLNEEQVRELAQNLSRLADEMKNNPALKNALNQLGQKLTQGGALSPGELSSLSDAVSNLMEDKDFSNAMSEISKELKDMNSKQGSKDETQGQEGNGQTGQGQSGSQGGQQGQNGQGGHQGQGSGTGSGVGDGTDMGSENQEPQSSQGSGLSHKDSSQKNIEEYEKIFTPKTIGGDGQQSQLKGQPDKGGSTEVTESDKPLAYKGDSVPYNKVYGEYRDQAFENINSSTIPEGMKEIVKDYFTSLDE